MAWSWRYEDADGAVFTKPEPVRHEFPTQADAESWLGENWRDLLEAGVSQVTLLDGESVVYGPMGLNPAT